MKEYYEDENEGLDLEELSKELHFFPEAPDDTLDSAMPGLEYGEEGKEKVKGGELFRGLYWAPMTGNRQANLFRLWLMGEKGYGVHDALNYSAEDESFPRYSQEFLKFLNDNRLRDREGEPVITGEELKARTENIVRIYKRATDTLKQYTLPDIDYSDPEQVRTHCQDFPKLSLFTQDVNQEMEMMLKCDGQVYNHFVRALGGEKSYGKESCIWSTVNLYSKTIADGYSANLGSNDKESREALKKNYLIRVKGVCRYKLKKLGPKMRGKTVEEFDQLMAGDTGRDLVDSITPDMVRTTVLTMNKKQGQSALEYLQGQNTGFEKDAGDLIRETDGMAINSFQDMSYTGLSNIQTIYNGDKELVDHFAAVFPKHASADVIRENMKTQAGVEVKRAVGLLRLKFIDLIEGKRKISNAMDMGLLDFFLVDNKSPFRKRTFLLTFHVRESNIGIGKIHFWRLE